MAVDFDRAFDALMETDYWMDVFLAFAGFMFGLTTRALVEGRLGQDLPNALYGAPAVVGGLSMGQYEFALGGAVYSVDALTMQTEVQSTVLNIAGAGGA